MDPRGQTAPFANPTACATELGWRSVLAPFPAGKPIFFGVRRNPAISLPLEIADLTVWQGFPLQPSLDAPELARNRAATLETASLPAVPFHRAGWTGSDSAMPPGQSPRAILGPGAPVLGAIPGLSERLEVHARALFPVTVEPSGNAATSVLFAQAGSPYASKTTLPEVVDYPLGRVEVGLCAPRGGWKSHTLSDPRRADLKFLPVRGGPILPAVRSWPRLALLPR